MHTIRSGGKYAKEQQRLYEIKAAAFVLSSAILLIFPIPHIWVLSLIFFGLGWHYFMRSRNWRKGILGEKRVGEALTSLDNSYVLINDVVLSEGKSNIDHILVCPNGVFVIETKNYSGEITCKQDSWYYYKNFPIKSASRQVKRNALSLQQFLKGQTQLDMFVQPILVFTDSDVVLRVTSPTVPIINLKNLCNFIKDQKTQSVLDVETKKSLIYEIRKVANASQEETNTIKKWLLKYIALLVTSLMVYLFYVLIEENHYGKNEFRNYKQADGRGIGTTKLKDIQGQLRPDGKIIGNKKSKIYHIPEQANYGRVKEENRVYFNSEEEAVKAGYRKAKR